MPFTCTVNDTDEPKHGTPSFSNVGITVKVAVTSDNCSFKTVKSIFPFPEKPPPISISEVHS